MEFKTEYEFMLPRGYDPAQACCGGVPAGGEQCPCVAGHWQQYIPPNALPYTCGCATGHRGQNPGVGGGIGGSRLVRKLVQKSSITTPAICAQWPSRESRDHRAAPCSSPCGPGGPAEAGSSVPLTRRSSGSGAQSAVSLVLLKKLTQMLRSDDDGPPHSGRPAT